MNKPFKTRIKTVRTFFITLMVLSGCFAMNVSALEVGDSAPDFRLQDQHGDWHQLDDFEGQWLALYFYPKNDTPGCTTEACNFRDNMFAFRAIGAEVVGISVDSVQSHSEFSEKYRLPFTILADSEGEVSDDYGVLTDYKSRQIAARESFLINPEGMIVKHYQDVDPETHTQIVLADLKSLMEEDSPEA